MAQTDAFGSRRRRGRIEQRWESTSHWRNALCDEAWLSDGEDRLATLGVFARTLEKAGSLGTVLDWGCGIGDNAVTFAPRAETFIAADISAASLVECERRVRAVCATPIVTRRMDRAHPERAAAGLEQSCSTFLCLDVLDVTTGWAGVQQVLRIAEQVLVTGGTALVGVKHHGLRHARDLATTTFTIDEFWELAHRCGLVPKLITLVPQNRLDVRDAYYALEKP